MTFSNTVPTLETERLIMRGWRESDLNALASFMANEQAMTYLGGALPRDKAWRSMASTIGHWQLRGYGFFALEEKVTGKPCGWCGPWCPEGWPEPELGWSIYTAYQGKGYATEAARRAINYTYDELGLETLISLIDDGNEASKGVARKLGAICEDKALKVTDFTTDIWRHLPPAQFRERFA